MTEPDTTRSPLAGVLEVDGFDLGYRLEGEGKPLLVIGSVVYYPRTFSPTLRRHRRPSLVDHRSCAHTPQLVESAAFDAALLAFLDGR